MLVLLAPSAFFGCGADEGGPGTSNYEEGLRHYKSNNFDAALDAFGKALDRRPGDPQIKEKLAWCCFEKARPHFEREQHWQALSDLSDAKKYKWEEAEFHYMTGWSELAVSKNVCAVESFKRAVDFGDGASKYRKGLEAAEGALSGERWGVVKTVATEVGLAFLFRGGKYVIKFVRKVF